MIFFKNKEKKPLENTKERKNYVYTDEEILKEIKKIEMFFQGEFIPNKGEFVFKGIHGLPPVPVGDFQSAEELRTYFIQYINNDIYERGDKNFAFYNYLSPSTRMRYEDKSVLNQKLNSCVSHYLGYGVTLGEKRSLTKQDVDDLINQEPIKEILKMEQCFPNSHFNRYQQVLVFSTSPDISIDFSEVKGDKNIVLIENIVRFCNQHKNDVIKEYFLSGLNTYLGSHLSVSNGDLHLLEDMCISSKKSFPFLSQYLKVDNIPYEAMLLIRDNFIKTGTIEMPHLAKGDKEYYVKQHIDFLKTSYKDFIKYKIYDFDANKTEMLKLMEDVDLIDNYDQWENSESRKSVVKLINNCYKQEFTEYQRMETVSSFRKSLENKVASFCFQYYEDFDRPDFIEDKIKSYFNRELLDHFDTFVLQEVLEMEKEKDELEK